MKKQKGITLIALIITIIVMLILVGVTVSVSLNGGLFSTAKKATNETEIAAEKERLVSIAMGAIGNDGKVVYDKLDTAIAEDGTFEGTGGKYTSKKTGNTYTVNEYGNILNSANGGTIISDTDTTNPSEIEITYEVSGGYITFYVRPKGKLSTVEYKEEYFKDFSTEELEDLYVQIEYGYDTVDNYATAMAADNEEMTVEDAKQSILENLSSRAEYSGKEYEEYLKDELVDEYYRPYVLGVDALSLSGESLLAETIGVWVEHIPEDDLVQALEYYDASTKEELKTVLFDYYLREMQLDTEAGQEEGRSNSNFLGACMVMCRYYIRRLLPSDSLRFHPFLL